ncbi:MAG TPA: hypothetical protein VG271_12295 [Beijerinckiaceae bacterium]|nr:hypothetical protein [Beijerinckiaceae bacterium]
MRIKPKVERESMPSVAPYMVVFLLTAVIMIIQGIVGWESMPSPTTAHHRSGASAAKSP